MSKIRNPTPGGFERVIEVIKKIVSYLKDVGARLVGRNGIRLINCWNSKRSSSSANGSSSEHKRSHRRCLPTVSSLRGGIQRGLSWRTKTLNPRGSFLQKYYWNYILAISCMFALLFDTLFFYIPVIDGEKECLGSDNRLAIVSVVLRTLTDTLYVLHILFRFRARFLANPVSGKDNPTVRRYLSSYFYFIMDILSVLPVPQVAILVMLPRRKGPIPPIMKDWLTYALCLQIWPRLARTYPLYKEVKKTSTIFIETAWVGAALNLILYMLASHGIGAFWYFFAIERKGNCLRAACERQKCANDFSYCGEQHENGNYIASLNDFCPLLESHEIKNATDFYFGIFLNALRSRVVETRNVPKKILYCFWWGLRSVSSLGHGLETSTYEWEILFAVFISTVGLVLFAFLIGNMQKYLQSITVRVEERRSKRRDLELWMSRRMLRQELMERIRRYEQNNWQENRGVEEESIIQKLPNDIRTDVMRHLCLVLLKRVPKFDKMDQQLLETLCDKLKPVHYTTNSFVVSEGDPVDKMIFFLKDNLLTVTSNGGRIADYDPNGFNSDYPINGPFFCGGELLRWAFEDDSQSSLPTSTRTVQIVTDNEAFALMADDLKLVASQFQQLQRTELNLTLE